MPSDACHQLLLDLCAVAGIGDAETVLKHGSVTIKGIVFSLYPGNADKGGPIDTLMIYCDFGDVPMRNEAAALRRLLEVNLFLSDAPLACAFVINPDTRRVVFSFRLPLSATSAEILAHKLEQTARQAEQWRKSYFLDVPHAKSVPAATALKRGR